MIIEQATQNDAPIIHDLMIKAFMEYQDDTPPSSALEETVESVFKAIEKGERAFIAYNENQPVGMIRFHLKQGDVYFYRLAVLPEHQGKGIAKRLIKSLELYAQEISSPIIRCKVRVNALKNLQLYTSIGYSIYDKEIVHKPNGVAIEVISLKKQLQ